MLLLPDDVIIGEPPATRQLIDCYERCGASVVAVEEVPESEVSSYGIVAGETVDERVTRLSHLVEKPPLANAPSRLAIVGRYLLTPAIWSAIDRVEPGYGGELQITDALQILAREEGLYAYRFHGRPLRYGPAAHLPDRVDRAGAAPARHRARPARLPQEASIWRANPDAHPRHRPGHARPRRWTTTTGPAPSPSSITTPLLDRPGGGRLEVRRAASRRGEGAFQTYDDIPVVEGYTSAETVGLVDLLRRRRDETERLLARGGLVVCFAYPDVAHPGVAGFTGFHRYHWLPAPEGCDYGPAYVKPASGRDVKVIDCEHPFANLLDSMDGVLYRASFTEGAAGFPDAKVIARSPGGAAIAIDVPVGGGRVIFLPALSPNILTSQRSDMAAPRSSPAIRNTLLTVRRGRAAGLGRGPAAARHRRGAHAHGGRRSQAGRARSRAGRGAQRLPRPRPLPAHPLAGGQVRLRAAGARRAGRLLGVTRLRPAGRAGRLLHGAARPSSSRRSRAPARSAWSRTTACASASRRASPHEGRRAYGLIVVNGYREQAPDERPQQYAESLRVAAESMRYCVVTATDLFDALRDKLEGRGDADAFLQQLIATEGVFRPARPKTAVKAESTTAE